MRYNVLIIKGVIYGESPRVKQVLNEIEVMEGRILRITHPISEVLGRAIGRGDIEKGLFAECIG